MISRQIHRTYFSVWFLLIRCLNCETKTKIKVYPSLFRSKKDSKLLFWFVGFYFSFFGLLMLLFSSRHHCIMFHYIKCTHKRKFLALWTVYLVFFVLFFFFFVLYFFVSWNKKIMSAYAIFGIENNQRALCVLEQSNVTWLCLYSLNTIQEEKLFFPFSILLFQSFSASLPSSRLSKISLCYKQLFSSLFWSIFVSISISNDFSLFLIFLESNRFPFTLELDGFYRFIDI